MKNHNQFVRCVENIQDLSGQKLYNYAMILGGGGMFSKKTIKYDTVSKLYKIRHGIDNSKEEMTETELKKSLMGKAMRNRSLIAIID